MGCGHVNPQLQSPKQHPNLSFFDQNIGLMTLKILSVNFNTRNCHSLDCTFDHFRINFSNQSFKSFIHHNFGHKSNILAEPSSFIFIMNSFQKQRRLEVRLLTQQEMRDKKRLAVSHFDGSSLIFDDKDLKILDETSFQPYEKTIYMKVSSNEGVQVCSLSFLARFIPQKYETLTIIVNSITLRNYSSTKRKVYIHIQVGQEIYESTSAEEDKSKIPSWSDAFHTFLIPASLKEGIISVYEKKQEKQIDKLLGKLRLNLNAILADEKLQQSYCEEIMLNQQITGSIKLLTLKNVQSSDIQKLQVNLPKKIKLEKQPHQNCDDFVTQINQIDTYKKLAENNPTTNVTSHRSKNFSSGKLTKGSKSKDKASSIYKKNSYVLPSIKSPQSAPLTAREKEYRFWLDDDIYKEIKKRQSEKGKSKFKKLCEEEKFESSFEKVSIPGKSRINIIKTQSFLLPSQVKKSCQKSEYELIKFTQFQPLDHDQKKTQFTAEKEKLNQLNLQKKKIQNYAIKRDSKVYTSFNQTKVDKMSSQKGMAYQRFISIQKKLESKDLQSYATQKNSKNTIIIEPGYTEFDLSLKDESNQSQRPSSCQADLNRTQKICEIADQFVRISVIDPKDFKKINKIRGLNKFFEEKSEYFQKGNLSSFEAIKPSKSQIYGKQIKPIM